MATPRNTPKRPRDPAVGAVLLAAGYGTRLARDMRADPAFHGLAATPKPLLPLGGRVLADHWAAALPADVVRVVVVSNLAHRPLYDAWAAGVAGVAVEVVDDGSVTNEGRAGAVAAVRLGLERLRAAPEDVEVALVIAGDTLLPGVNVGARVAEFCESVGEVGVFAYRLKDLGDCVRRGMLKVGAGGVVEGLVEKPASVEESPSDLATAPVYLLRRGAWGSVGDFLERANGDGTGLDGRDAPGFWLADVIPRVRCVLLRVEERVDIGGLAHYKDALLRYAENGDGIVGAVEEEVVVGRAMPRVGLLGNPSDGYRGRCVAFVLASEGFAEVVATPAQGFEVLCNPAHEMLGVSDGLEAFARVVRAKGVHYGARQLVVAAAAVFAETVAERRAADSALARVTLERGCALRYSTTIPASLGLSGSSALVLATFRALARFYGTALEEIDPDIRAWPARVLRAETELLGHTAGLMDRVAQVYGGVTFMDFSEAGLPRVERLDGAGLPKMWLAYRSGDAVGEGSSVVHSRLRERFSDGEREVVEGMAALAELGRRGRAVLLSGSREMVATELPKLVSENWALRVKLVGREAMAAENVRMVECAHRCGFAGKQTGSGGAILCVPDPPRALDSEKLSEAEVVFAEAGYVLRPVVIAPATPWRSACTAAK